MNSSYVTDEQRRALFKTARSYNLTDDVVRAMVRYVADVNETKLIKTELYESVIVAIRLAGHFGARPAV